MPTEFHRAARLLASVSMTRKNRPPGIERASAICAKARNSNGSHAAHQPTKPITPLTDTNDAVAAEAEHTRHASFAH